MNARVNQKLYFAKLVLDLAHESEDGKKTALLEAALFHLVNAYRNYLLEIIDDRQIVFAESATSAVQQQQQLGLESKPELQELFQLEHSGAWSANMLAAYGNCISAVVPIRPHSIGIALADVTLNADQDNCQSWLDQFQQLLVRQRDHAHEW
ncbi:MAG: hypothetical protein JWM78_520 [Verrucomicrobiaceae bacterium]|nr:hypothetical protein [Verrucomicrobiaceae bacterium]